MGGIEELKPNGWRARIGVIVPPSNTTNETEFNRLKPDGVSYHFTRSPMHADPAADNYVTLLNDVDAAVIYDAFSSIILFQLESFGFCDFGEAKDFIQDGALEVGGRLPSNTHGGQLSEAYIHGINGVNEGVRLVRGTSVNQPEKNDCVLVTAGVGVPTSAMILGKLD